jgi:hypothetical protein
MFGSTLLGLLDVGPKSTRAPELALGELTRYESSIQTTELEWRVRQPASESRLVYTVGWSGDGTCLAVTNAGLEYWDGTGWQVPATSFIPNESLRFATLCRPGVWLLGGEQGAISLYSGRGEERIEPGAPKLIYQLGSGDPDDLAVFYAQTPDGSPMLCAQTARRWLRPTPLDPGSVVNSLSRLSDDCWLVIGRDAQNRGFTSLFEPLMWALTPITTTPRALVAGNTVENTNRAVAAGPGGTVVSMSGLSHETSILPGQPNLSCVSIDATGRVLAGSAGELWERSHPGRDWQRVWHNTHWQTPFVSLFGDVGLSYGLTAEGAILEGRTPVISRAPRY